MEVGAWEIDSCRFLAVEILILECITREILRTAKSTEEMSSTEERSKA